MRILSFGDLHFNCGYDEDLIKSVDQIINYVRDHPVNLIAITGDVYDRSSDPTSRNVAANKVQLLSEYADVLIVRGNHDSPGDLKILGRLETGKSIVVDEVPAIRTFGGVVVHTLPWLTKARWQALHPEASRETGDQTVSQLVLTYLKNSIDLSEGQKQHVLIGHLTVAGAKAQNHRQMGADGITVGMYDLKEAGFYAALLGHIHLRQQVGDDEKFFYNGSIAALDYGETPTKWFSVLDTELGRVEWVKLDTIHRQDINVYWTPTGIKAEDAIHQDLLKGARVRANLRVAGGDNVDQAKAQLEEFLRQAEVLEFKINPQVVPVMKIRAIEIAKAKSMSAKLGQYWEATEYPDGATQEDMLSKLSTLEDECSL